MTKPLFKLKVYHVIADQFGMRNPYMLYVKKMKVVFVTTILASVLALVVGCTKAQNLASLASSAASFPIGFSNTSTNLPNAFKNQSFVYNFAVNNGVTPLAFTISAGTLPAGLTIDPTTGVLAGAVTSAVGNYAFTVKVVDATNQSATLSVTLGVSLPFSLLNGSLPNAIVNSAYTAVLSATGGTPPYVYAATGLPTGLSIASNTGIVSGTPSNLGLSNVAVTVTDSANEEVSITIPLTVGVSPGALLITTSSVPGGTAGSAYAAVISANGGVTPFTYIISAGALPSGLTLDANTGVISGTPIGSGTYAFTVRVTDAINDVVTQSFNLTISSPPPPVITTSSLPVGQQQQAYSAVVLAAGGSTPYAYSVSTGALPAGLTLGAATGLLSGVPTVSGTTNFTIQVTDHAGSVATANFSLTLSAAPVPTITTSILNPAVVGVGYTGFITTIGGTAPYTYAISTGTLPTGISLNAATGTIYGAPTASGTSNFKVTVTDALNNSSTSSTIQLQVNPATSPTITTSTLPVGQAQVNYGAVISASGGTSPYTFAVTTGSLPAGLSLASSSGLISGVPTASGTVVITFKVTDNVGSTSTATLALTISAAAVPSITTTSLPVGQQQVAYSTVVLASGGSTPYTFAINAGALPAGLSLSTTTGLISGTPTVSGTFNFSVQVTDHVGSQTASNFSLTLNPAPIPSISTTSLNAGQVGSAYAAFITASGGTPPYTFSLGTGALPAGVSLNTSAGVLFGTPTASGTSTFKIIVTDSLSNAATSSTLSLLINPPTSPTITTSSLPNGQAQVSYSSIIQASGGTTPYTFSITSGTLPAGLSLNASTGQITGTPTANGTSNITFKVTDNVGSISTAALQLVVATAASPVISTSSLANGQVTIPYTAVITSTGGNPLYTYAVTTGSLPPGLTLTANTGVISGTPTANGTTNFSITATDSTSVASAPVALSITVAASPYATLAFQTTTLLPMTVGQNDTRTVSVTGGLPPYSYAVSSGTLPTGVSLNTSTGAISGIPTTVGSYNFTLQVTDNRNVTASQGLTLNILNPLLITTTSLPVCIQAQACSTAVVSSGGTAPYTYTATGVPSGLAMAPSGIISGSAVSTGISTVKVTVTDSNNLTSSASFYLTVAGPLSIATNTVLGGAIKKTYSQTISAAGGVAPYTFTQTSGTLPTGLTLSSAGVLSGTPAKGANARTGTFNFGVQVQDSTGTTASKSYAMTISIPPTVMDDISNRLRTAAVGVAYSEVIRETGGVGALTYTQTGLPTGLTINSTSGYITGTPGSGTAGTYTVNVTITDANGMTGTRSKALKVVSAGLTASFDGGIQTSATTTYASYTYDTVMADMNNDGFLDVVTENQNTKQVLIFLGTGTGTFTGPYVFTAAANIQNIAVADMNADSKLDLIVSETGTIEVVQGDNSWLTPNTLNKVAITTNLSSNSQIAIGDLNNDGKLDIVAANSGNATYSTYLNCQVATTVAYNSTTPACTAGTPINYYAGAVITATGTNTLGVGLIDLNGDGKLDVVGTAYNTRTVSTWLGNNNGTFAASATSTSAVFPYNLGWVRTIAEPGGGWKNSVYTTAANYIDMNNDNLKDVVVQANQGSYILLGNGSGAFSQTLVADISDLGSAVYTKVSDVNGDGFLDIISAVQSGGIANIVNPNGGSGAGNSAEWSAQIFFGNGTGNVTNRQVLPGGALPSVAVGNVITSTTRPNLVEMRLWNGQYPYVAVRPNNLTTTAFNYGQFQFAYQSVGNLFYDYSFSGAAVGDINGDGIPDFIAKYNSTGSGNAVIFTGNAQGGGSWGFTSSTSSIPTGDMGDQWWNGRQSILVDIDGDGVLDYANSNWNNAAFSSAGYTLGNGDGTFGALNFISTDASGCTSTLGAESIAFGDFNRDGKMDMAVGEGCNGSGTIMIFYGNGDGSFNTASPYVINSGSGSYSEILNTYDVNGDGLIDLIGVSRNGNLQIYLGKGDGTFTLKTNLYAGVGANPNSLEIADLNNDGIPDYVIATTSYGSYAVLLGGSGGTIASTSTYSGITAYNAFVGSSAKIVDWDQDGNLDVLYGKEKIGMQFFKGNGTGAFAVPTLMYSMPNPGLLEYNNFSCVDINGDGLPDIISINGDNNMMSSVGYSINKSH